MELSEWEKSTRCERLLTPHEVNDIVVLKEALRAKGTDTVEKHGPKFSDGMFYPNSGFLVFCSLPSFLVTRVRKSTFNQRGQNVTPRVHFWKETLITRLKLIADVKR